MPPSSGSLNLEQASHAYDAVTNPLKRRFSKRPMRRMPHINGLGMLLFQGAAALKSGRASPSHRDHEKGLCRHLTHGPEPHKDNTLLLA